MQKLFSCAVSVSKFAQLGANPQHTGNMAQGLEEMKNAVEEVAKALDEVTVSDGQGGKPGSPEVAAGSPEDIKAGAPAPTTTDVTIISYSVGSNILEEVVQSGKMVRALAEKKGCVIFLQETRVNNTSACENTFPDYEVFLKDPLQSPCSQGLLALFPKCDFSKEKQEGKYHVTDVSVRSSRCQIFTIDGDWMTLCNLNHKATTVIEMEVEQWQLHEKCLTGTPFSLLDEAFQALRSLFHNTKYFCIAGDLNYDFRKGTHECAFGKLFQKVDEVEVPGPGDAGAGGNQNCAAERMMMLLCGKMPLRFLWEEDIEGSVGTKPPPSRIDHFVCNERLTRKCSRRGALEYVNNTWTEAKSEQESEKHRPIFALFELEAPNG